MHGSREARKIVQKWLAADGLLEKIADLNELGLAILENVAPVAPEDILAGLERALLQLEATKSGPNRRAYLDLLRSLSYEADMFNRSVELITHFAVREGVKERSHATEVFVSLFHLALSGTHASIEQRLAVIESLLKSSDDRRRALGVLALKAALKSRGFQSFYSFEFGGHSRDYGYWPLFS